MLNYYQPFLWPFLRTRRYQLPVGVAQRYYHSAEDALWDILAKKNIAKGGIIMVPTFYCIDVVQNIEAHGYPVRFYEVDEQFQTTQSALLAAVKKHRPVAVVLFHAAGIQFQPVTVVCYERIQEVSPGCLFLEDNVHRLTDPERVRLFGEYHLVLDSLRKDSPLPGSFAYGTPSFLNFPLPTQYNWHWYRWAGLCWYLLFRATFVMGVVLHSPKLVEFAHDVVLKKHDDLIGDVDTPPLGFALFKFLHQFLDFAKVRALKSHQVERYKAALTPLLTSKPELYPCAISVSDAAQLHVFPVGVRLPAAGKKIRAVLQFLHSKGVIIWAKFPDAPWSRERAILFFPLGFHIDDQEIEYAITQLHQALIKST